MLLEVPCGRFCTTISAILCEEKAHFQGEGLNPSGGLLRTGLSGAGCSQHLITMLWSKVQMAGQTYPTESEVSNRALKKSAEHRDK